MVAQLPIVSDSLSLYLAEIRKFSVLSEEDEHRVAVKFFEEKLTDFSKLPQQDFADATMAQEFNSVFQEIQMAAEALGRELTLEYLLGKKSVGDLPNKFNVAERFDPVLFHRSNHAARNLTSKSLLSTVSPTVACKASTTPSADA